MDNPFDALSSDETNILIAGSHNSMGTFSKFDQSGNKLWEKSYPGEGIGEFYKVTIKRRRSSLAKSTEAPIVVQKLVPLLPLGET